MVAMSIGGIALFNEFNEVFFTRYASMNLTLTMI